MRSVLIAILIALLPSTVSGDEVEDAYKKVWAREGHEQAVYAERLCQRFRLGHQMLERDGDGQVLFDFSGPDTLSALGIFASPIIQCQNGKLVQRWEIAR